MADTTSTSSKAGNDRDRPSAHGKLAGKAIALLESAGRREMPGLPEGCATCAFREGCMTNMMAGTTLVALKCALGQDADRFACHHGMKDGQPKKLCAGYVAAILASHTLKEQVVLAMVEDLACLPEHDQVRADFDAWIAEVDPAGTMDDYERARWYERHRLSTPTGDAQP